MTRPLFEEIHIENTNSCGYKCVMCPRESQTRSIGFMSPEDFSFLLDRVGPFEGIFHLHGFGEPLLDRKLAEKLSILKKKNPQSKNLIFSTLGVKVKENHFTNLIEAGLDCLIVSLYGFTEESYKKIHGFDGFNLVKHNLQNLSASRKNKSCKVVIKIPSHTVSSSLPMAEPPERISFCKWVQELGFDIGEWTYIHNYSDGRSYNLPNKDKMCPVISGKRKNILNVTWDLKVIPCCYDFNATIPFGNLREQTLEEIFSSPQYLSFIIAQKTGNLEAYPACQNCEKNDYS